MDATTCEDTPISVTLLLSGLRYGGEVSDCGCQQTGSLPSETEMRALVRSAIQKEQGGDAK